MAAPREIELKLELDPLRAAGARRRLRRLPDLRAEGETRRLVSAIFDTPDHALRKGGLVLRIRRDGERRIQTLKAAGPGTLIERSEWESEVWRDEPDPALIPDPALRARVEAAGSLAPVLETDFERTFWHVRREGSDVEVAFDEGTIRAGGRTVPIGEIELELKSGSATALFSLGREIVAAAPARLGLQSKSERGYALLDAAETGKAEPFLAGRKMKVGAAFQAIVRTCLRHYCLNEPGIFARQVEALHKARVAIRRLRSCWKLHKALLADAEGIRLGRELRALSRSLGAARNLDVHLGRLAAAPAALRAAVAADRERAYDRLARLLRSRHHRLLLLDVVAYAATGEWLRDPARRAARGRKVSSFAAKILRRRWKKLRKAGRDLAGQTPQARHRVRIEGKVLRYAAEFFAAVFPGRKADRRRRKMLEALAGMQTHLGDLNDIETAAAYEANVAREANGELPGLAGRKAALLADAQAAHERLAEAEPFWR